MPFPEQAVELIIKGLSDPASIGYYEFTVAVLQVVQWLAYMVIESGFKTAKAAMPAGAKLKPDTAAALQQMLDDHRAGKEPTVPAWLKGSLIGELTALPF